MEKTSKKITIYQMTVTALFAAIMCILGPISIPVGEVPISLTSLILYFAVFILGTKFAAISYLIYFLLGLAGLPVFSQYSGGLSKVAGPTGGYLVGFFFLILIGGFFVEHFKGKFVMSAVGFVLATAVTYAFGTVWFIILMKCKLLYALANCVFPFLIGDAVKIIVACLFGKMIRDRLKSAGLIDGRL